MNIEFSLLGKDYQIKKITIRDYYKIKLDLILEGIDGQFAIVSSLSGCDINDLKKLPVHHWNQLSTAVNIGIQNQLGSSELVNQFTHDGIEYGLIDLDSMTIGEFADLDVIATSEDADSKIHEMLAILYRPIIKKKLLKNIVAPYDVEGFKERSYLFLDLPLSMSRAITGFFLAFAQASLKAIQTYLDKNPNHLTEGVKNLLDLLQETGGLQLSLSQMEMLSVYRMLRSSGFENLSTSLVGDTIKIGKKKSRIQELFKNISPN